MSYSVIGVFAEKGKLVLSDGKLSAKGAKGGQATLQLYVDREVVSACLKLTLKTARGSSIPPSSNALETPCSQNDDQVKTAATGSGLPLQGHRKEHYVRRRY